MTNFLPSIALGASMALGNVGQGTAQEINHTSSRVSGVVQKQCQQDSPEVILEKYTQPYTVLPGETLGGIAGRNNISKETLIELRKISEGRFFQQTQNWEALRAGQTIRIPLRGYQDSNEYSVRKIHSYVESVQKTEKDNHLNALYHAGKMEELETELNALTPRLFPKHVINLGIQEMSDGFLGNMKYVFNPQHPALIDKLWHHLINCSALIKKDLLYSIKKTLESRKLGVTEELDAWKIFEALFDMGYTRKDKDNFMPFFNKKKIGQNDIIDNADKVAYHRAILKMLQELEQGGIRGSMIAMYFSLSNYKWVVRDHNALLPIDEKHYNTHLGTYKGQGEKIFQADSVGDFSLGRKETMDGEVDSISYIANFVQHRGSYLAMFGQERRDAIIANLGNYHSVFHIEVNGKKINIEQELQKPQDERTMIQPTDIVRVSGSVVIDGYHDVTSDNMNISENNHVRTRFLTEFVLTGDYTISEKAEPSQSMQSHRTYIGGEKVDFQVRNNFGLQEGDTLKTGMSEAIIGYILEKTDIFDYTPEEIDLYNKLESFKGALRIQAEHPIKGKRSKKIKKKFEKFMAVLKEKGYGFGENEDENEDKLAEIAHKEILLLEQKRPQLKKSRIESLKKQLSPTERSEFDKEYQQHIWAYKLLGYMQSEGNINPGALKVNAPMPLFDTKKMDLEKIYMTYINKRKQELNKEFSEDCGTDRDFLVIRFLEGDNRTQVLNRIATHLEKQGEKYPVFKILRGLNPLQKLQFLREVVDKKTGPEIHLTKGIIPSSGHIISSLEEIQDVLKKIQSETHIETVSTNKKVDEIIISTIFPTEDARKRAMYTLMKESYIKKGHFGIRRFGKQVILETGLGDINSFGDLQMRTGTLNNEKLALRVFPTKKNIADALKCVQHKPIQDALYFRRNSEIYRDDVLRDEAMVQEIQSLIDNYTPESRAETGKKIKPLLDALMRLDDGSASNINGKTISLCLLKDKNATHDTHIIGWFNKMGVPIDTLLDSPELLARYSKTKFIVAHRGELTALRASFERYVLRVFEAMGENIDHPSFPKIEANWKGQVKYNKNTIARNTNNYQQKILPHGPQTHIQNTLGHELQKVQASNFSAASIYNFCANKDIQGFLQSQGEGTLCIPKLNEFENNVLFDYANPPFDMEPPKVGDFGSKAAKRIGEAWKVPTEKKIAIVGFIGIAGATTISAALNPLIFGFLQILGLGFRKKSLSLFLRKRRRKKLYDWGEKMERKNYPQSWPAAWEGFRHKELPILLRSPKRFLKWIRSKREGKQEIKEMQKTLRKEAFRNSGISIDPGPEIAKEEIEKRQQQKKIFATQERHRLKIQEAADDVKKMSQETLPPRIATIHEVTEQKIDQLLKESITVLSDEANKK